MIRSIALISCLGLALGTTACKKDEKSKPSNEQVEPTKDTATQLKPATDTEAAASNELALSLDFEDEAEASVTAENYEEILAALEAEGDE